jgi:hypothetical protein
MLTILFLGYSWGELWGTKNLDHANKGGLLFLLFTTIITNSPN